MSISTRQQTIVTSYGSLAVEESGQGGIPVLLIHGNSSCRGIFRINYKDGSRKITTSLPSTHRATASPAMRLIPRGATRYLAWRTQPLSCSES